MIPEPIYSSEPSNTIKTPNSNSNGYKASMRTIDPRALSVKLLSLYPTFCGEEKGYSTSHILQNLSINVKIE
jgi:hypothetical protein